MSQTQIEEKSSFISIVPAKKDYVLVSNGKRNTMKTTEVRGFLEQIEVAERPSTNIIGFMGGPSNEIFARAQSLGFPVNLVPFFRVQETVGLEKKETPTKRSSRVSEVWTNHKNLFYQFKPIDEDLALIRELTRNRLSIQEFRKKAQLQFYASLREKMRFILPPEAEPLCLLIYEWGKKMYKGKKADREALRKLVEDGLIELEAKLPKEKRKKTMAVMQHFANPRFIIETKKDEVEEERQIMRLLRDIPLYNLLVDKDLPWRALGLGPALGGAIVSEIYSTGRFPNAGALRAYARYHVTKEGFPRRKKGEVSNWNEYLHRAVNWWGKDQIHRWKNMIYQDMWLWQKAREFKTHPSVVPKEVLNRKGDRVTIYDFTLKHLDSRARRWTGSKLLEWTYVLGTCLKDGIDPMEMWNKPLADLLKVPEFLKTNDWFVKPWVEVTGAIRQELDGGLLDYVKEESKQRKKVEPVVKTDDEDDDISDFEDGSDEVEPN